MPAIIEKKNCTGEFLDDGQYSRNGILRYERIFGDTFVSTGGVETTKVSLFNTKDCYYQYLHMSYVIGNNFGKL